MITNGVPRKDKMHKKYEQDEIQVNEEILRKVAKHLSNQKYYENHKSAWKPYNLQNELKRQKQRQYYENNKDKINSYAKDYAKNNPDKIRENQKRYLQKEEVKARRKEYYKQYHQAKKENQ